MIKYQTDVLKRMVKLEKVYYTEYGDLIYPCSNGATYAIGIHKNDFMLDKSKMTLLTAKLFDNFEYQKPITRTDNIKLDDKKELVEFTENDKKHYFNLKFLKMIPYVITTYKYVKNMLYAYSGEIPVAIICETFLRK